MNEDSSIGKVRISTFSRALFYASPPAAQIGLIIDVACMKSTAMLRYRI
jgi:hypothetical protein